MKRRKDFRLVTIFASLAFIVAAGVFIKQLPSSGISGDLKGNDLKDNESEVNETVSQRAHIVDQLFLQATTMLHAKRYELAVLPLHQLLQIAPKMPEAHVNMGYAQLGMERHKIAEDFFRTAIELMPEQVNAYYGLALALEGQNDLEGARGAMRTFVHLSDKDDPYVRRAQAAIWEWSSASADKVSSFEGNSSANSSNSADSLAVAKTVGRNKSMDEIERTTD